HLGTTQVLGTVEWLPVEVGGIDHVPVHQGEAPDTGPGQPHGGRAAESPHSDDHRRAEHPSARVRHMRPALLPLLLLAAAGCRPSGSPQGTAPPPPETSNAAARPTPAAERSTPPTPASAPSLRVDAQQTACVDRWLKGHGLDAYGNPEGTMYAGGT